MVDSDEVCAAVSACVRACLCASEGGETPGKRTSTQPLKIPFMCDWGCASVSSLSLCTGWVSLSLRWLTL